ncbi:hypothetical protein ACAW74_07200 [Fibrella sp. WM1]|uniref:hypothetical protein n=1 Tax=Fibrella musci TaxID=3242485 RepID=UPI0035219FE0
MYCLRFFGLPLLISLCLLSCATKPDAQTVYQNLKEGEAHFEINMDGDAFYPADSRFKGEVTVTANTLRLNLFDQYESNTIITLDSQDLFAQRPVKRTITIDNQVAGSIMIGRVRDKAKRTGDGFLMTEGELTIESLSDDKIVIHLTGKTGNFNTMQNRQTWKRLNGLLVYRKPTITVTGSPRASLLY